MGVRKKVFENIQFDEDAKLSEDHIFMMQCRKQGYRFKFLREPQYTLSLRRFKKEGTLKVMRTYARAQLLFLTGKKVTTIPEDYPMLGGDYYHTQPEVSYLAMLQKHFAQLSRSQLERAKRLLSLLNEFQA